MVPVTTYGSSFPNSLGNDAHFLSWKPTPLHAVLPGEQRQCLLCPLLSPAQSGGVQSSRTSLSRAMSLFPGTHCGGPVVPFPGRHPQGVNSCVGKVGALPPTTSLPCTPNRPPLEQVLSNRCLSGRLSRCLTEGPPVGGRPPAPEKRWHLPAGRAHRWGTP